MKIFLKDVLENNKKAIRFYKAHGYIDANREIKAVLGEREYTCKVFEKAMDSDGNQTCEQSKPEHKN